MVNRKTKASNYERDLLSKFHDLNFNGVRVAGSGSGSFPSPDLLVGRNGLNYAIEVKTSVKDFFHVSKKQLLNLVMFSNNLGARPLLGVKFINKLDWFFIPVGDLLESDLDNIRISLSHSSQGFNLSNFKKS